MRGPKLPPNAHDGHVSGTSRARAWSLSKAVMHARCATERAYASRSRGMTDPSRHSGIIAQVASIPFCGNARGRWSPVSVYRYASSDRLGSASTHPDELLLAVRQYEAYTAEAIRIDCAISSVLCPLISSRDVARTPPTTRGCAEGPRASIAVPASMGIRRAGRSPKVRRC